MIAKSRWIGEVRVPVYEGQERRQKQRRIGAGRRAFRDRRVQERRFDVWTVVADDQRGSHDRRMTRRRLDNRRNYPNRRVATVSLQIWEIEVAPETPPTF